MPPNQFDSQPRMIPRRLLIGLTFCPILLFIYLNDILHGMEPTEEFVKLLTGEAARAAIATADACTRSRYENRKVDLSEIIGK